MLTVQISIPCQSTYMYPYYAPGYRLYLLVKLGHIVLLCGGYKNSQQHNIEHAGRLAQN